MQIRLFKGDRQPTQVGHFNLGANTNKATDRQNLLSRITWNNTTKVNQLRNSVSGQIGWQRRRSDPTTCYRQLSC